MKKQKKCELFREVDKEMHSLAQSNYICHVHSYFDY